jgi:parallel beta-helix repeat protein
MKKKLLALAVVLAIIAAMIVPMAVSASPTTWYVANGGSNSNTGTFQHPFATIEYAIGHATSGDTIMVGPGTYPEQLTITESLTLEGAGSTTIIAPTSMTSTTTGLISGSTYYPIILAKGPATGTLSNVNIENLKVDGAGVGAAFGSSGFFGIVYQDASGTISGTTITNINCNPLNGDQSGNAIYVQTNGTTGISTVTIENNIISNYQKGGIICNEAGTTCIVTGNTVTGIGPTTLIAQNGIQIGFGATATVENNTVSGNSYTGTNTGGTGGENYFQNDALACGILLYDANPSTVVSNNTASSNDIGICAVNDTPPTPSTPIVVSDNTLLNNYGYGVVFDSVNGTSNGNIYNGNKVMGLLVTDSASDATVTGSGNTFLNNGANSAKLDYAANDGYYPPPPPTPPAPNTYTTALTLTGSNNTASDVTGTLVTLSSIAVTPSTPNTLQAPGTLQFTAIATYSDGSTGDVTATATWTSGTPATATITSPGGLATGVASGTTAITASLSGVTSNTVTLTVVGIPNSISITVPSSLPLGTFVKGQESKADWENNGADPSNYGVVTETKGTDGSSLDWTVNATGAAYMTSTVPTSAHMIDALIISPDNSKWSCADGSSPVTVPVGGTSYPASKYTVTGSTNANFDLWAAQYVENGDVAGNYGDTITFTVGFTP